MPRDQCLPQWFHDMPADNGGAPTLKRCPPLVDAMSAGYIIPLPADITLIRTAENLRAEITGFDIPLVHMHEPVQFPGAPMGNAPIIKFVNPWLITTPPGYSTLFIPPMNRFDIPIVPICGLVETDTYYRNILFPAVCLLQPGMQCTLKRGMPLMQCIPILRESWTSETGAWDLDLMQQHDHEHERNGHMYKEHHWKKKTYA